MPGLDPGIHQSSRKFFEEDGSPGHLARRLAEPVIGPRFARTRWRFCPMTTISRRAPILIRRNLDQAAVGIPAIDRAQRAAGALFCHRTFLDRHAACGQMRQHLFRRAGGEKAQIVAAGGFMIRSEPLDLVRIPRPHIDLLIAEHQRRPWRFARARIEHPDLHAEDFLVPLRGIGHVGDVDDDMIERVDLDSHALSFWRGPAAGALLAASGFVCYNVPLCQLNKNGRAFADVRQGETAWLHAAPRFAWSQWVFRQSLRSGLPRRWTIRRGRSASWLDIRPAAPPIFWRA